MTIVSIKPIGNYPDVRKLADAARGAFDESLNTIGNGAQKDFEDIVSGWKHKPVFVMKRTKYTVSVTPEGPNARIWRYVDEGTAAHQITARGGGRKRGSKLLTFKTGYQARSRPNNTVYKGSGTATGAWVSKKQIRHPGSKARSFTRIIRTRWIEKGRAVLRTNLQKRRLPT